MTRQLANHAVQIKAMQLAIGVVKNDSARHLENVAGGGELLAALRCQFLVALTGGAVPRCLPGSKAKHTSLDAAIVIELQSSAKGARFIIRVRGDAHETQHKQDCTSRAIGLHRLFLERRLCRIFSQHEGEDFLGDGSIPDGRERLPMQG